MTSPLRATDPARLGRYEILSRLGEGGMGTVYLARDPGRRLVAVKVIRPEYAHDTEFRARFRSEVNRARQVPPFCTAEVLDADPDHDPPYLVVEYVDGPSLAGLVDEQGPLSGGNLHSVAVGVAAALAAIHGAGVIHRDLKPRNVLFSLGTPKVIDFGIARALEATSSHTRAEEMVGTVAYMAPERFDPDTDRLLTPAADIFAWAAVVTYAGTGRTPFAGDTPAVTAARILTQPPRLGGLPEPIAGLVEMALAKNPRDRPTAHDLLDLLLAGGGQVPRGGLTVRPEVRRAAEAAQHSGRYTISRPHKRSVARRRLAITWVAAATAAVMSAAAIGLARRHTTADASAPTLVEPSPSAVAPLVRGPSVFDALDRSGQWADSQDVGGGCTVRHGLAVTTTRADGVRCGFGPDDVFPGDQSIDVAATLRDAGSCAAVWFRVVGTAAYRLSVCPSVVALDVDADGEPHPVDSATRTTTTGTAHRLNLTATAAGTVDVSVDGTTVLRAPLSEPALATGQVQLGALARKDGSPARVTYTDVALRSGTGEPAPAFLTGDARFTARFWSLDPGAGTGVLEQVRYVSGKQYCADNGVAATSPRCAARNVAVPAGIKVTLPLAADHRLREYRDHDPACTDPATHAGVCSTTADRFNGWATGNSPFPALVTVTGGRITEVAELDLPG